MTTIHEKWCSGDHIEVHRLGEAQPRRLCITVKPNGEPPMWWYASDDAWQELGYRIGWQDRVTPL